jgi:hypothetical protein
VSTLTLTKAGKTATYSSSSGPFWDAQSSSIFTRLVGGHESPSQCQSISYFTRYDTAKDMVSREGLSSPKHMLYATHSGTQPTSACQANYHGVWSLVHNHNDYVFYLSCVQIQRSIRYIICCESSVNRPPRVLTETTLKELQVAGIAFNLIVMRAADTSKDPGESLPLYQPNSCGSPEVAITTTNHLHQAMRNHD